MSSRATARRRRIRLGHRVRATVTFAVAAAAVSALLAGVTYAASRSYLTDQRETAARNHAYLNARAVREQLRARGDDPGGALASLAPEEGAAALLRVDGEWYSSSVAIEADDLPRGVLAEVETGVAAWQRYELRGVPHLAVAVPLPAVRALYAEATPLRELDQTLSTIGTVLLVGALSTVLVGAAIGFLAAGRLVRPLRLLAARAEAIAAGDRDALAGVDADPELAPFVRSLNEIIEGHARQVESGSRFVSDVSHEIRAPLAALSAAVEVMRRRRAQLPARSAQALDLLGDQVEEFQQLVLDLLEISRIDAGNAEVMLEPTSCRMLAEGAARLVGATLDVRVDDDVPEVVLLDRRRMNQVLGNLLENARRYAGGATEIVVARPDPVTLTFSVRDHGPGVPVEERDRIFRRFERGEHGHRGPSGTGLGLALAAEHAALLGGGVRVEDAEGGGARFVVEVRLCTPE